MALITLSLHTVMTVFFITGTSGSGKSTLTTLLKKSLSPSDFCVYDFDENGVPENADAAWRKETTEAWLKKAEENGRHNKATIVCGVVVPSEVLQVLATTHARVFFGFMNISDELIRARLKERCWNDQVIQDNSNWAHYLQKEVAQHPNSLMVDCSSHPIEEIGDRVIQWIRSNLP